MATNQHHPTVPDTPGPAIIEYYQNLPVVGVVVIVSNTGDGLSEAMSVEPQDYNLGAEAVMALRLTLVEVRYRPISKDTPGLLEKVLKFRAGDGSFVEEDDVAPALTRAADLRRAAREAKAGVAPLFSGNGEDLFDDADFAEPAPEPDDGQVTSLRGRRGKAS